MIEVRNNLTIYEDGEIIGWVNVSGCENNHCSVAVLDGRPWHAIVKGGALPDHHFASFYEATEAIRAARPAGPSIVQIPGTFYARYNPDRQEVEGWGFTPYGSNAGWLGPTAQHIGNREPECDVDNVDSPFWRSVQALLHDVSPEMVVEWTEDGWKKGRT